MASLHEVFIMLAFMLDLLGSGAAKEHCLRPGQAPSGNPPVTTKYDITCARQLIELHCCVGGGETFDRMWWFHEERPLVASGRTRFRNFNQTLVIEDARTNHTGTYECLATNDDGKIVFWNNITLDIIDCSKAWTSVPIPKLPLENKQVIYAQLGQTVSLSCSAFFGHSSNVLNRQRFIIYSHEKKLADGNTTTEMFLPGRLKDHRITLRDDTEQASDSYEVQLRIENLQESDLGLYTCQYGNLHGSEYRSVTLALGDETKKVVANKPASYGLVGLSAIFFVLIAVVLVVYIFRVEIQLFLKEAFWHKSSEGRLYEAFVFYHDADGGRDARFVTHVLQPKLEADLGYQLGLKVKDFTPGLAQVSNYEAVRLQSGVFLFVMSPSILSHQWSEYAFHHAVANHHKVAFLVLEDVADDIWTEATKPMKKAMTYGGRTVKYPGDDATRSELDKFWKKLRLLLPGRMNKERKKKMMAEPYVLNERANEVEKGPA